MEFYRNRNRKFQKAGRSGHTTHMVCAKWLNICDLHFLGGPTSKTTILANKVEQIFTSSLLSDGSVADQVIKIRRQPQMYNNNLYCSHMERDRRDLN